MKTKIEFSQTIPKRPLIHIPNRPEIYIYPNSECYLSNGVSYNSHRYFYIDNEHHFYTSNLIDYSEYGLIEDEARPQWITDMLNGKYLTPLEIDQRNDKIIAENYIPKRDIITAKYQFSNSVRPTNEFKYIDGMYHNVWAGKIESEGKKPLQLAWYLNRNVMVVLPKNVTECSAKLFEELHTKKKRLIEANK